MIVCVCNRLSDSACSAAAKSGQCRGVGCIYRLQGCRVQCGRCVPMMQEILAEHAPKPAGSGGAALHGVAPAAPER